MTPVAPELRVPYGGIDHSVGAMKRAVLSTRGAFSPVVRQAAEDICRYVSPKDYRSEALAIRYWASDHCPYFRDPAHVERIRDAEEILNQVKQYGNARIDCDEHTVLVVSLWLASGNEAEFITAGFTPGGPPTHVFGRCLLPYSNPQRPQEKAWLVVDPVAGTKESTMLPKVKFFRSYPLI